MGRSRARSIPGDFIDRITAARMLGLAYGEAFYRVKDTAPADNPFPQRVHRVSNSDIWSQAQLLVWQLRAAGKPVPAALQRRAAAVPPWPDYALDREGVAQLLNVTPPTVSRYAYEGSPAFPTPLGRFAGHPIWHRDDVLRWQKARPGRYGSRRGPKVKGRCPGCGWPRVLRADGKIMRHPWSPKGRIEQCPGSDLPPASTVTEAPQRAAAADAA